MEEVLLREYGSSEVKLTTEQYEVLRGAKEFIKILGGSRPDVFRLEASSWVGHILAPGLKVIIEPKIGSVDVLRMIIEGDGEAVPRDLDNLVKSASDSLWDIIADGLVSEVLLIQNSGLRRDYVSHREMRFSPRGQVAVFHDLVANTPIRKGVVCDYDEFSPEIPVNVALKWGLETVEQLASARKAGRIRDTLDFLAHIPSSQVCPIFDMVGSSDLYARALWLVKLIERSLALNVSRFGTRLVGFGVDMNKVFEGFVRSRLRNECFKIGLSIGEKKSASRKLCEVRDLDQSVHLEPDLLVTRQGRPVLVGDCKYKLDWSMINSDVYQMLAYLEGYQTVENAAIFYVSSQTFEKRLIELPRDRYLALFGLPYDELFNPILWKKIAHDIGEVVCGEGSSDA